MPRLLGFVAKKFVGAIMSIICWLKNSSPPFLAGIKRIKIRDRLLHCGGIHQILLFDEIEIRICVPHFVGKPSVLGRVIAGSSEFALRQQVLRLDVMFDRLAPKRHLMFNQFCRIIHHFSDIGACGLHIKVLTWALQEPRNLAALPIAASMRWVIPLSAQDSLPILQDFDHMLLSVRI